MDDPRRAINIAVLVEGAFAPYAVLIDKAYQIRASDPVAAVAHELRRMARELERGASDET